jgi:predicted DNA-binding WGR domain protein
MTTACTLHRIDPARHMARFYAMDVQPDLFGCIVLTKQWGRIGAYGRRAGEYRVKIIASFLLFFT